MKTIYLLALGLAMSLALLVRAELKMTDIAGQCADTAGFNTCWSKATNEAETCYTQNCEGEGTCNSENDCTASNPNCVESCSCVAYAAMIQCALESCWNMVTSCQYQNLAVSAAMNCPIALGNQAGNPFANDGTGWVYIPYFPSSPTRPGACSCNLAFVYLLQRAATNQHTNCQNSCDSADHMVACDNACDCCVGSERVSAFYNVCPDTDPAAAMEDMPQFDLAAFEQATGCDSVLGQTDCASLGYSNPQYGSQGGTFYAPDNLPSNGSNPLSNGQGSITTPLYATITWALGNGLEAQTAVAVTTGRASGSSSEGGGNSGSGSGSGSASATATGASHTSAAGRSVFSMGNIAVVVVGMGIVLMI